MGATTGVLNPPAGPEEGKRRWRKLWHDTGEQFIADWEKEQRFQDGVSQFLDEAIPLIGSKG